MIRRRRPVREIAFSFDSFLDVVANVVGIIIRLILIAWVGARSYKGLSALPKAAAPAGTAAPVAELQDPLRQELDRHRDELAALQARLLEQLRQVQDTRGERLTVEGRLQGLAGDRDKLRTQLTELDAGQKEGERASTAAALSLEEIRRRGEKLKEEVRALEQLPPLQKVVRYRTPVSRPVNAEEFLFECRDGRVSFIDLPSFVADIRRGVEDQIETLRSTGRVSDVTNPAGAFRLRYTLEREGGLIETSDANLALEWVVEPVAPVRGETEKEALAAGSEFRQIVDRIDPQYGVVTFWVYPESFALYRTLRDYLYERDLVVAGRPLPEGVPISCSPHGSRSRGQ